MLFTVTEKGHGWMKHHLSHLPTQILCETEQVLLSASSDDMSVCILRLGGIYGPRRELVKYLVEWLVQFVPVTVRMQQLDPP